MKNTAMRILGMALGASLLVSACSGTASESASTESKGIDNAELLEIFDTAPTCVGENARIYYVNMDEAQAAEFKDVLPSISEYRGKLESGDVTSVASYDFTRGKMISLKLGIQNALGQMGLMIHSGITDKSMEVPTLMAPKVMLDRYYKEIVQELETGQDIESSMDRLFDASGICSNDGVMVE